MESVGDSFTSVQNIDNMGSDGWLYDLVRYEAKT